MTSFSEQAVLFDCSGEELVGIITRPREITVKIGCLVVVGGPQYRVGSHRQFALLARDLAQAGIACMRFDYRGMGDSTGEQHTFENVDDDIRAAVDVFEKAIPGLSGVVLWGLCDGATAAAFYSRHDQRVCGLMLLNPWVKTEAGEAKAYLKHYYLKRFCSPAFWKKFLTGGVSLTSSLGDFGKRIAQVQTSHKATPANVALPERMLEALEAADLPMRFVLSGRDYVAREFAAVAESTRWQELLGSDSLLHFPEADHTFSTAAWRAEIAARTIEWIKAQDAAGSGREHQETGVAV